MQSFLLNTVLEFLSSAVGLGWRAGGRHMTGEVALFTHDMTRIHRPSKEKLQQSFENLISESTWVTVNKINITDFYTLF